MTLLIAVAVNVYPLSCFTEFNRIRGFEVEMKSLKVKCVKNLSENCIREN